MKAGCAAMVEVQGKFNVERFFETLALLLSEREHAKITVKVTQKPTKEEEEAEAGQRAAG